MQAFQLVSKLGQNSEEENFGRRKEEKDFFRKKVTTQITFSLFLRLAKNYLGRPGILAKA